MNATEQTASMKYIIISTLLKPKWLEEMSEHEKKWVNKMSLNTNQISFLWHPSSPDGGSLSSAHPVCLGRVRAAVAGMAH